MISSWLASLWGPASKPPTATAPPPPTIAHAPPPPRPQSQQDALLPPPTADAQQLPPHSMFTPRSMKQLTLFLAGATFLSLTTAVTRRSVVRKIRAAAPRFYHPSYHPPPEGGGRPKGAAESAEGTLFALEALGLATLNTFSFAIMATGGLAWAFDVSSLDDLRARARRHQLAGRTGEDDAEAEDTIEEWMASMLGKGGEAEEEGKEERDAKEWMATLLVRAKDKVEAEEGKKKK